MLLNRLFRRPSVDAAIAAENRQLRRRLERLELEVVRRRTDDILSTRDHLMPVPRPGTSAAKLLSRNRALQKRLQALLLERQSIALDLVDAANEARAAGLPKLARSFRERAEELQDVARGTPVEVEAVDSSSFDEHAATVLATWRAVDKDAFAQQWWARLTALEPRASSRGMPPGLATLAEILVLTLAGRPAAGETRSGPARAAEFLRSTAVGVEITDDSYAVAAEATLYALALQLGSAWTEDARLAWCQGIDAVARGLGLAGMSGTVLFSSDEWDANSRT